VTRQKLEIIALIVAMVLWSAVMGMVDEYLERKFGVPGPGQMD